MKVLHLTLTKEWFGEILSGRKKDEYRDIKEYWRKRLVRQDGTYLFKEFDEVHFKNGYRKDSPFMRVKWIRCREDIKNMRFIIKLGEVLEVKNWEDKENGERA